MTAATWTAKIVAMFSASRWGTTMKISHNDDDTCRRECFLLDGPRVQAVLHTYQVNICPPSGPYWEIDTTMPSSISAQIGYWIKASLKFNELEFWCRCIEGSQVIRANGLVTFIPWPRHNSCRKGVCGNAQFLHGRLSVSHRSWDKSKNPCLCGKHTFPNLVQHQNLKNARPAALCFPDNDDAPHWEMYNFHMGMDIRINMGGKSIEYRGFKHWNELNNSYEECEKLDGFKKLICGRREI